MEDHFRIAEVNVLPSDTVAGLFARCLNVGRWTRELAAARPFADLPALLARADELAAGLSDGEVRQALDDHPRIGARTAPGSMSEREQSGVDTTQADTFAAANVSYEERFGHIYLVCAAGRGGAELLADLNSRLANDSATEIGVARRELGRIAHLRLAGMIDT